MVTMMKRSGLLVLSVLQLVMLVTAQGPPPSGPSEPSTPPSKVTDSLPQRIDTHCHYLPPFYRELLVTRNFGVLGNVAWNASAHLDLNAQLGIVTSVVSVSLPGAKLSADASVEEGRALARQLNEYGYNLTKEYPGRFLFWGTLTLPDLEGAVAEAIYALDTLGAAGIFLQASAFGELLGTPRYAPLYKILDDRKAVVFVHPSQSPCPGELPEFTANSTDIPPAVAGYLLDTSRAALNLVFRNVTTDYPNIKFILAHSGGFLPFAATRMANGLAFIPGASGSPAVYYQKLTEFHVDLALSASNTALASTTIFFNNTQLTFGTDYPFAPLGVIQQNTGSLVALPHLHNAAKRKIDYDNAYQLLKKFFR